MILLLQQHMRMHNVNPVAAVDQTEMQPDVQSVEHHCWKVHFFSTSEVVNAIEQEKSKGEAGRSTKTSPNSNSC